MSVPIINKVDEKTEPRPDVSAEKPAEQKQEERKFHITRKRIQDFLNGTRDPNKKIHETWALGFQLELILKNIAAECLPADRKFYCTHMESTFIKPVLAESKVIISVPREFDVKAYNKEGGRYDHGLSLDMFVENEGKRERTVRTKLLYETEPKIIERCYRGHFYTLTEKRAKQTASGLLTAEPGVIPINFAPDYSSLALGLVSNATFQDSMAHKEKGPNDPSPIYVHHSIDLSPEMSSLKDKDLIRIWTSARNPTEDNGNFVIKVEATKPNGIVLYDGELKLKFYDPNKAKPQ